MKALLAEKPEGFKSNSWFVFSTTNGAKPFSGFSKAKKALDAEIARIRKAEGRDKLTRWTLHDLRRTGRSLMSRAKVPADHAERALGHVIGGVRETYDRYEYLDEKREAFEKLAQLVALILQPPANNVLQMTAASLSQRNRCSLSRSAASSSMGLGAIPSLFLLIATPTRPQLFKEHYSTGNSLVTEFKCLFWVKHGPDGDGARLLVFPEQRTSSGSRVGPVGAINGPKRLQIADSTGLLLVLLRTIDWLHCRASESERPIRPKQQEISGRNEKQRQQRSDGQSRHHEHRHRLP
jgi:hypothetical protein